MVGLAGGLASALGWYVGYFRLIFWAVELPVALVCYALARAEPRLSPRLLRLHPVSWDEIIWLPLPLLDRLLVLAVEQDQKRAWPRWNTSARTSARHGQHSPRCWS